MRFSPSLAKKIGLNEAIFVQKLYYWLDKSETIWAYNTYDNWQKQFNFWSISTIKRIILSLKKQNIIIVKNCYYSINYERIIKLREEINQ